jgi:uncharacterized membrane-anchored protein
VAVSHGTGPAAAATSSPAETREVSGIARLGKRTKHLVKRLVPGDVAIIDHLDLDRVSGEDLVNTGVEVVINCSASSSGKYPNAGPLLLAQGGIHLVDAPGAPLFDLLHEGDPVVVRGGQILRNGEVLATGTVLDAETLLRDQEERRRQIGEVLESFAQNTVEYMVQEKELLSGRLDLPKFRTDFRDRPALVVVRGVDHKRDLKALRGYIRDNRPVLIGVDGGADAIIDEGFEPDMIVGDMDSAAIPTLHSGAELVVHAYSNGRAPGRELLEEENLPFKIVAAPGTSQDIAMLIAAEKGARIIVSVGSHFNLVEFLDKGRAGMSSTFLTRLRIGEILVDAKGVSRLYRRSPSTAPLLLVFGVGLLALFAIILTTPGLHDVAELLWLKLQVLLGFNV